MACLESISALGIFVSFAGDVCRAVQNSCGVCAIIPQMCAFWSSVALMTGRYHGTPMAKHLPLPVDAGHFDRWLELFEQTAREICPPEAEAHFVERARRIAASLELGIAGTHGVMLGNGERFRRNQAGVK